MKRYLLFCYSKYYPGGGQDDVEDSFDTLEECYERIKHRDADYSDILDLQNRVWIKPDVPNPW